MGVNDDGWQRIFDAGYAQEIAENGYFTITARELERISGRQPRLMAKHDFSAARPAPFRQHGANILPLSRSEYLVGRFDVFQKFPQDIPGPVRTVPVPMGIESLDFDNLSSEALALSAASLAGIFEDFLRCGSLRATVAGRMSSGTFPLSMAGWSGEVDRAQIEIDGGFESTEHVVLVEAKNRLIEDFNVRQVYFPYRRFQAQLRKPVVPLYMVYSNGIFHLYRYDFTDPADPQSITLVDAARYALGPTRLDLHSLADAVRTTALAAAPSVPFPQADSFARVIDLVEKLERPLCKDDITELYGFTPRQTDYYANAAAYVGLAQRSGSYWTRTEWGDAVMGIAKRDDRNLALVETLARDGVFKRVLAEALATGAVPARPRIVGIMQDEGLALGASTLGRRAATVESWTRWVLDLGDKALF